MSPLPPTSNQLPQPEPQRPMALVFEAPAESPATKSCRGPTLADTAELRSPGTERIPASRPVAVPQIARDRAPPAEQTAKDSPHTVRSRTGIRPRSDSRGYTRVPCGFPGAETPASLDQRPETASAAQSCCASNAGATTDPTAALPH